jgi:hypothetical protein
MSGESSFLTEGTFFFYWALTEWKEGIGSLRPLIKTAHAGGDHLPKKHRFLHAEFQCVNWDGEHIETVAGGENKCGLCGSEKGSTGYTWSCACSFSRAKQSLLYTELLSYRLEYEKEIRFCGFFIFDISLRKLTLSFYNFKYL